MWRMCNWRYLGRQCLICLRRMLYMLSPGMRDIRDVGRRSGGRGGRLAEGVGWPPSSAIFLFDHINPQKFGLWPPWNTKYTLWPNLEIILATPFCGMPSALVWAVRPNVCVTPCVIRLVCMVVIRLDMCSKFCSYSLVYMYRHVICMVRLSPITGRLFLVIPDPPHCCFFFCVLRFLTKQVVPYINYLRYITF